MPKCPKDCHKPNPLIFRRVIIPSALGDDKENPPENGAYCNAIVIYEANSAMYLYSSDGIPTKIPTSITSYNDLTHKPSINGVELEGDISLEELGISDLIEESVASEATARAEADESLQDAIDAEEAARIAADRDIINSIPTVNDATLTIQRNGTSVGTFTANSASDTTINIDVPIYTSGLINDSGYVTEAALSGYATDQDIEDAVSAEASIRANADRDLQSQIDAISSASDVVDVVGTYAELQNYDTSKLSDNDIIKVLTDSTHDNAISYYRWDDANDTFVYIGSQGPFYTKSETDATFVPQTRTVNGKALSTDIALTASDVSALPASTVIPTVNNATLTIKKNGNNIASFTANSATDVSADITVPTKTSDLTNDSDFVSDASYVHTDNNFTTAEKNKLAGIAAGAEVNVQSDWNQTNSSADGFIKNKPTIPTKTSDLTNDSGFISSLPIASASTLGAIKVGTNLSIAADGTLSADAQSITVDSALSSTSTNPVENRVINTALGTKANTADLAEVATSGDYDDLLNKPTIPTVNNATITIQRNSANVDSFTVNASQNKTINIAVPTKTSDLTNDSNFATTAQIPTKTSDLTNDGADGTSTYVEADGLAAVATSGSYTDLSDKPTIGNATLTIQKNGTNVQTFTANATSNKTANITVPTKTSDLTNDSNFVSDTDYATASTGGVVKVGSGLEITNGVLSATGGGTADAVEWDNVLNKPTFSTVATSGSYNDLTDKPTIPTVNNATLTIQRNSTNVGTFTANASSNKTINITVPTTAADVSALPASTKYGASITVSLNTTDYKMTTTLKDQDGNTLGTAQTIDLPLESVVVNGSYDSTNKKIVLTLQSGSTIDIPVGDLIAGLQTEITSTNKLSSDLVDDTNHTHKFVTAAQITKLNGIAAGAEVNVQSDWNQTTTTADDYIKNKPSLATVATSGSYNDLSNKPTIPTVNNATLTIQRNSTNVGTFTANASSNKTINIVVPTQTSDLTNDSGFITNAGVTSFNGSTGAVTYTAPVTSVNGSTGAVTGLQTTSNLVTSVSSSSTNSQYPSAKLFYDTVGDVESVLQTLNSGNGAQ